MLYNICLDLETTTELITAMPTGAQPKYILVHLEGFILQMVFIIVINVFVVSYEIWIVKG